MKVSANWLKEFLAHDLTDNELSDALTSLGLEVEGIEDFTHVKGNLKGVVVGHVLSCEKHPNADRLQITQVDIGSEQPLDIVCGAPNVAKGQKVLVATVGTKLYPVSGEPFDIKKAKIRGSLSQGMICAEDELGLGESHDGILVLDEKAVIGQAASDYFAWESDQIYDIGLTPNRVDAMSYIGVAADLKAWIKIHKNKDLTIQMPTLDNTNVPEQMIVKVTEQSSACIRYSGVCLHNVQISESPQWLKDKLIKAEIQPINNVVDITNLVMTEFGQPLHAFDLSQIQNAEIRVKKLEQGIRFKTLDDQVLTLDAEDLMICDGRDTPMCIAGVFGGADSGITENTTSLFLESACFDAGHVRRSSQRHQLFTASAKVFEKGSDPNHTLRAIQRAVHLLKELAGAKISSTIIDHYPVKQEPAKIDFTFDWVNAFSGLKLSSEELKKILFALDMRVTDHRDGALTAYVPTNKPDVLRKCDLMEEVLRVYGLENIPNKSKISYNINEIQSTNWTIHNNISDFLVSLGLHETISISLMSSKEAKKMSQLRPDRFAYINNTSNANLDILRPHPVFAGLENISFNQNRQIPDLRFFEIAKSYQKTENNFQEKTFLCIWITGDNTATDWLNSERKGGNFYDLKGIIQHLLERLKVNYQSSPSSHDLLQMGLEYSINKSVFCYLGKLKDKLKNSYDIRNDVYFAQIDLNTLSENAKLGTAEISIPSRFPSVFRDLSLIIDEEISFNDILECIRKPSISSLTDVRLFDVFQDEKKIGKGKKSYAFRLQFNSPDRSLENVEVDGYIEKILKSIRRSMTANLRS